MLQGKRHCQSFLQIKGIPSTPAPPRLQPHPRGKSNQQGWRRPENRLGTLHLRKEEVAGRIKTTPLKNTWEGHSSQTQSEIQLKDYRTLTLPHTLHHTNRAPNWTPVGYSWKRCRTRTLFREEHLENPKVKRADRTTRPLEEFEAFGTCSYSKYQTQPKPYWFLFPNITCQPSKNNINKIQGIIKDERKYSPKR